MRNDADRQRHEAEETMSRQQELLARAWRSVYFLTQDYLNRCLDLGFDSPWALDERCCRQLRINLDCHKLIEQQEKALEDLKGHVSRLRSRHKCQLNLIMDQVSQCKNRGRADRAWMRAEHAERRCLEDRLRVALAELGDMEHILNIQRSAQEEANMRLIRLCIAPMLDSSNGESLDDSEDDNAENNDDGSSNGGDDDRGRDRPNKRKRSSDSSTSASLSSPSDDDHCSAEERKRSRSSDEDQASRAGNPNARLETPDASLEDTQTNLPEQREAELREAVESTRSVLNQSQRRLCDLQRAEREGLTEHLLTFTNSSVARFEQLIAERLEDEVAELAAADTNYVAARQAAESAGLTLRAPERTIELIDEAGRLTNTEGDRMRVAEVDRGVLNHWRVGIDQGSPASSEYYSAEEETDATFPRRSEGSIEPADSFSSPR